jgi:DNA-binding NarL/FixJ family response regulator
MRVSELPASNLTHLRSENAHFVVIEDDALLRDLMVTALQHRFEPATLRSFANGREGLEHCVREPVDLLLTDLRLPDLDGRDVVRQLRARDRKPRVIVLTGQVDGTLPAELIALGVAGFVDKASPLEHAMRAVERVLAGGMYFFAGITPSASGITGRSTPVSNLTPTALTPRERDIARHVASGLSSKEIAQKLELSTRTVENYRANLLQKLGLRDTASLVRWCVHNGLE